MAIATAEKKTPVSKKGPKTKYIVRPGFSVLVEDGKNRQMFGPGENCELTESQFKKVAHQVEEHTEETAKRITAFLDSQDEN